MGLPIRKYATIVLCRNAIMLQHLIVQICKVVTYGRSKTKENKVLTLKEVVVAYESWSLTNGSKESDLTWKLLVFWKTVHICAWHTAFPISESQKSQIKLWYHRFLATEWYTT